MATLTGTLNAEENYDPSTVAQISGGTQPSFCTADQTYPGMSYDPVQRLIYYAITRATASTLTNTTGHTLWSGYGSIAPSATYDATTNFNYSTCTKSIDTGAVTFYEAYSASQTVPAGIGQGSLLTGSFTPGSGYAPGTVDHVALTGGHGFGAFASITVNGSGQVSAVLLRFGGSGYQVGDVLTNPGQLGSGTGFTYTVASVLTGSDGTWRRYTQDALAAHRDSQGNGPGIVDSYTGNFWIQMESCELYCFRKSDGFAQVISPLISQGHNSLNNITPVGITFDWVHAKEQWTTDFSTYTTTLYLTPRVFTSTETTQDYLLVYAAFNYPSAVNTAYYKEVFDQSRNFYVFGCQQSGTKDFRLWRFTPPTSAPYGGPTVGGGFTDITPWASGTGPNTDASGYTLLDANASFPYGPNERVMAYYLPDTNDLALISEFYPAEHTAASTDPALYFIDCTYVHAPNGTPTFDQHSKFVTGYMKADWTSTGSAADAAAYAVTNFMSVDHFITTHDFDYRPYGVSYTERWFNFVVHPVSGGVVDTSHLENVLVLYRFAYGSAPQVVSFTNEDPWNNNPAYSSYDGFYVVEGSMDPEPGTLQAWNLYLNYSDRGLWDNLRGSWWWSGQNRNVYELDPAFSDRNARNLSMPFLRVALRSSGGATGSGKTYARYGGVR